jgi:hypothetical protein
LSKFIAALSAHASTASAVDKKRVKKTSVRHVIVTVVSLPSCDFGCDGKPTTGDDGWNRCLATADDDGQVLLMRRQTFRQFLAAVRRANGPTTAVVGR